MSNVLVAGANRGIGLEFVNQYLKAGDTVHACCRDPDNAGHLQALADGDNSKLHVHALDVANTDAVNAVARSLKGVPLNLVLSVAGINIDSGAQRFGTIDYDAWATMVNINAIGAARVTQAFCPQLAAAQNGKIVYMSSITASMGSYQQNSNVSYGATKAELNRFVSSVSATLAEQGISTLLLHPGWVRTDMGGSSGKLDASDSVAMMRCLIEELSLETTGRWLNVDGESIPW